MRDFSDIGFGMKSAEEAKESGLKWFAHNKGGGFRRWYGNQDYVINWMDNGKKLYAFKGAVIRNPSYYFKHSLSWPKVCSNDISFRYYPDGFIYDCAAMSMFFNSDEEYSYYLAYLNSKFVHRILEILSPTLNFEVGQISRIPACNIEERYSDINGMVQQNIAISKLDWDSHETSWNFEQNELIAFDNEDKYLDIMNEYAAFHGICADLATPELNSLEWRMNVYKTKWETKFMQLHANEEELNRQFIDIYGLQDELTPDVPLDEVTILQQGEVGVESNALIWHDEVILKQLLSYAAGAWMGRYRLGKPGLHIAHPEPMAEELASYTYRGHTIEIDDDGIFPLMAADSGFTDNACLRTAQFVSDVFGAEHQVENLNYIERTLGKTIEQYWQKDFWKDHKKMYQNRPIYWLFASKKGTFQCIAYLHRMTPYTPERIRSKYLLPFIETLGRKIADLTARAADLSIAERKHLDTLNKQLEECREYHDRLAVVAEQAIPLDLDDGVVVNYAKLGDVLQRIK